ncbi:MAG: GNAT family N-acetyltransferase [Armatimonadota bacterium]|nr:GNAT family N-acetyltransferase [Armatimonadota bacterium]
MTIRPLRENDYDEHAELVYVSYSHGKELPQGSMLTHRDWWLRSIERDPYYRPEQTRVMEVDGRLVASVSCYHRPTYVAGRRVDAACIGSVCTHPDHRRQGYIRQVLVEAAEWMAAQGWEWSFLYGREEIYGGSGWRMLSSFDLIADLGVRREAGQGLTERRADPERDIPVLSAIYSELCGELTGPTVRTDAYWRKRVLSPTPWGETPDYRILERAGEAIGYFRMEGDAVGEIGWRGRPHDVLAHVLRRAEGPVSFACFMPEMLPALRDISEITSQKECFERAGGIRLRDSYKGLWRHHRVDEAVVPEVCDTRGLVRFLRERDYVMWPADKA